MNKKTVRGQPGKYIIKATKVVAKPKLPENYHIPLDAEKLHQEFNSERLELNADRYHSERTIINEINHYEFKEQLENNKE